LEVKDEEDLRTILPNVIFEVIEKATGEMTFKSERQSGPWKFFIKVEPATGQMSLSLKADYSGLSVEQAWEGVKFLQALAHGGDFLIYGKHPVTGEDLPVVRGGITPGEYEGPDVQFVELLDHLTLIQSKTGIPFTIPERDITFEEAASIAATAYILMTGHAKYEAKPWVSFSSVGQAKETLASFESGEPQLTTLQFDGQEVEIFGTRVSLGPVVFFLARTYITEEDLGALRRDIQRSTPESRVKVRLTPFEDCPVEARYINWLPADDAAALQKLLARPTDKSGPDEDRWELPPADVDKAVSLLQSWNVEDQHEQQEQRETWEYLKAALDEDRLSDRKLFA
jgi:hypothetical protein